MQCTLSVPLSVARTITFQYLFLHLFPYDRHIARIMRDPIQPSSSLKDRQPPVFLKRCVFSPGAISIQARWKETWHSSSQRGNISKKERGRILGRLDSENARDRPDLLQFSINKNWQCFFDSPLSKCLPSSEIRCYVRDCEARLPLRMMDGCVGSWTMNRLLISGEQLSVIFCLS